MHILLNISRSKDNLLIKCGQLIEYNKKYFSWKIIHKIWWRNYSQTLLYKIKLRHISGSIGQSFKVYLYCMLSCGLSKKLKLSCRPLNFISYKAFLKSKKRSGTKLPTSFTGWSLKKNISLLLTNQISLCGCLCFVRYWTICVLQLFVNQVLRSHVLKLILSF